MSRPTASGNLTEVKTEKPRRHTQGPAQLQVSKIAKVSTQSSPELYNTQKEYGRRCDYVYVNSAFVGSVDNVQSNRLAEPPTSVIREQYWACSKWPFGQRILAIAVGVLLGAVIGLIVTVILKGDDQEIIPGFFMSRSAPD